MALTDDMALYALGIASRESHPIRLRDLCLNTVQCKFPCTDCSDACPEHIDLHGENTDWSACTNCNLCVTACPTGAIRESAASLQQTLSVAGSDMPSVTIACGRYGKPHDIQPSCIAAMPWEEIALIALEKRVILKTSPCRTCPETACAARIKETIGTLRRFFGAEEFAARIMPKDKPAAADGAPEAGAAQKSANRRAIVESTARILKGAGAELGGAERRLPDYRTMLRDALAAMPEGERPACSWETLAENGSCRACGICVKMCPRNAFALSLGTGHDSGGETDSNNVLIHDASLCTQCGLCYMSCPEGALEGWETLRTAKLPAEKSFALDISFCEKCGKPFKKKGGATRCTACSRFRFA